MKSQKLHIQSIGQINIPVRDLASATAFYQDILGLALLFEVPNMMSFFDCHGVRLMLAIPTEPEFDHPSSIIYYRVADIHQAYEDFKARGVIFTQAPHSIGKMDKTEANMPLLPRSALPVYRRAGPRIATRRKQTRRLGATGSLPLCPLCTLWLTAIDLSGVAVIRETQCGSVGRSLVLCRS